MKRLLCIVGGMNTGGAETFLMKVYRALDKTKYQMDFAVAIQKEGFYDQEIVSLGGRIYKITPKSKGLFKNFHDIKKTVKINKYNSVLRTSQNSLSALELLAAKQGGAKIRVFRSSNSNTVSSSRFDGIIHRLFMFMPRKFANVKIAPSTEAAEFMFGKRNKKDQKICLLHNGIDLNVFHYNEQSCMNIRKELNISEKATVFGHIGRFSLQKNHMFLLEVFKEISLKDEHAIFMLVGGGELELKIKEKAEELGILNKIIFTGIRSDIPALLSAMDVFVFPSFYEGMPNTVIEAQATGLPCVIADTITKEADITGLVDYVSLQETASTWAKIALQKLNIPRKDTKEDFIKNKYDVESVAKEFVSLVFGEN